MAAETTTGPQTLPPKTKKRKPPTKKAAKPKVSAAQAGISASLRREVAGLAIILAGLGILLALVSFQIGDLDAQTPANWIGPAGVQIAGSLLFVFGVAAFFLDAVLWYLGLCLLVGRSVEWKFGQIAGQFVFVFCGAMLFHLAMEETVVLGHAPGGLVGELLGEFGRAVVGNIGGFIVAIGGILVGLMLTTRLSLGMMVRRALGLVHRSSVLVRHKIRVHQEFRAQLAEEQARLRGKKSSKDEAKAEAELAATPLVPEAYEFEDNLDEDVQRKLAGRLKRLAKTSGTKKKDLPETEESSDVPVLEPSVREKATAEIEREGDWQLGDAHVANTDPELPKALVPVDYEVGDSDIVDMQEEKKLAAVVNVDFGPQIVESESARRKREGAAILEDGPIFKPQKKGEFAMPPLKFLNFERSDGPSVDPDTLRQIAAQIEKTLADFKVDGQVVEICPGPVITMFEYSPAPGVKLSKIAGLTDDLAMALSAHSVRIVAPIPGKGVVGIEVPNPSREMVYLKEVMADDAFQKSKKMKLPLSLGFDVEGTPIVADLARMPHLLVAGATGAGKSVAVNTMICSLLYKHSPADVRLIMVDPKMLEFSIYADIPHLLLPVVTDPKQATVALNWAVQEMERRYQNLADLGVRSIDGYNTKVATLTKRAELDQLEGREESAAMATLGIDANGKPTHSHIPYIVVIIDEFADLMMTAAKDVELAVARLAQKARAAGIHLILATQRPSTDVITGLIKANFPTRIALRVTSKIDSRVILDHNGAENLLGNGDMLFVPPGSSALKRVHGAFVSETEIDKIVAYLKEQGGPEYNESILIEEDEDGPSIEEMDRDDHYEDAVRIVVDSKHASISMIQRKLRVGYNRAARMVEMMEVEGIVSSADGCKPREVLLDQSPYL